MHQADYSAWLEALPAIEKVDALLHIIWELTLIMRTLHIYLPDECDRRWRLGYKISEMNHAFSSAARKLLAGDETYSRSFGRDSPQPSEQS